MKKILLGTHNQNKLKEIRKFLESISFDLIGLSDVNCEYEVEETGSTLEENAVLKSKIYSKLNHMMCLSDDTGLYIDALHGAPGVISSRYAGEKCSFIDNIKKVLEELKGVVSKDRTAVFKTVLSLYDFETDTYKLFEGELKGHISEESNIRKNNFGYDPIFLIKENVTLGDLSLVDKNKISHRRIALEKVKTYLLDAWKGA